MRIWLLALFVFAGLWTPAASAQEMVDAGEVEAGFVSDLDVVAPGETVHIALRKLITPHWHTYWRNPGDSGEATFIEWQLPLGVEQGEMLWPTPKPVPTGPIINYGYEDELFLITPFKVSDDAQMGSELRFDGTAYWLVCADICIPESASLSITVTIGENQANPQWKTVLDGVRSLIPQPTNMDGRVALNGETLSITFADDIFETAEIRNPYFFPYDAGTIEHSKPQNPALGDTGVRFDMTPSFNTQDGITSAVSGVLAYDIKDGLDWRYVGAEVQAAPGALLDVGAAATIPGTAAPQGAASGASIGFLAALIGAFLGGIILNLMPCVFPVISIKALTFAGAAHEDASTIRRHGLIYALGVILSFVFLASLLLFLKAFGLALGWGFQLQSPIITGLLALLMFAIGLNLAGYFDVGKSFQGLGHHLTEKGGNSGAFFTGVLAVIVASPCTAPFMATAIGFAFTQSIATTLLIFVALGLGMALPFVLLSFAPGLLRKLPKPGPWMDAFKRFLAFPMFATAIWLVFVLAVQAGSFGVGLVLTAALALAFGLWLMNFDSRITKVVGVLALISIIPLLWMTSKYSGNGVEIEANTEFVTGPWSEAKVQELRGAGHPVFVDFTAAWCVTCQANKIVAIDKPLTRQAFAENNVAFLTADWTSRNDEIATTLEAFGRAGVPLYLVYPAGTGEAAPQVLPQILTEKIIVSALEDAKLASN